MLINFLMDVNYYFMLIFMSGAGMMYLKFNKCNLYHLCPLNFFISYKIWIFYNKKYKVNNLIPLIF